MLMWFTSMRASLPSARWLRANIQKEPSQKVQDLVAGWDFAWAKVRFGWERALPWSAPTGDDSRGLAQLLLCGRAGLGLQARRQHVRTTLSSPHSCPSTGDLVASTSSGAESLAPAPADEFSHPSPTGAAAAGRSPPWDAPSCPGGSCPDAVCISRRLNVKAKSGCWLAVKPISGRTGLQHADGYKRLRGETKGWPTHQVREEESLHGARSLLSQTPLCLGKGW